MMNNELKIFVKRLVRVFFRVTAVLTGVTIGTALAGGDGSLFESNIALLCLCWVAWESAKREEGEN